MLLIPYFGDIIHYMAHTLNMKIKWKSVLLLYTCCSLMCSNVLAQDEISSQFNLGINASYKLVIDREFSALLYGGYGTNISVGHSLEKKNLYAAFEFNLGYARLKKLLNNPSPFVIGSANSYESYISYQRAYEICTKDKLTWCVGGNAKWLADVIDYTGYVNFSFSHEINLSLGGVSRLKYVINNTWFFTHSIQIPLLAYSSRPDPFGMYPENETMFHYLATGKLATINKVSYLTSDISLHRINKRNKHQLACFYRWSIGQNTIGSKKITVRHQLGISISLDVSKTVVKPNE